jgi:hypothetical protein
MTISDETLMAYADGELDGGEREKVAAAVAADPALAERLEQHRALRARLGSAYAHALEEPAPDHLLGLITRGTSAGPAEVIDLSEARARRRGPQRLGGWAQWAAMAACFALGLLVAAPLQLGSSDLVRTQGLSLVAHGRLDRALTTQLASDPQNQHAPVRILLSFRTRDGGYCRTFNAAGRGELSGLACREVGRWRVMTAVFSKTRPGAAAYRTAGAETPQAIKDAVAAAIAGDPLDARAEAAARGSGWRAASQAR